MLSHTRSKKWIAKLTAVLMVLMLVPAAALAASSTTWSQAGYDNVSETWTPGNIVKYYEGSYVPYRANAKGYVPTGQTIDFDLDYMESGTGAIGYDQATNWFIGPYVPYSGSPTLYTKADINAYALATYGHAVIEPDTQFMGADAFTVDNPVQLTSGGAAIPPGYSGDTILRYHVAPNLLGYVMGSPTADPGSFIDALMTWYGGDWAMYYEAHLAESGAPNLFEGGTVVLGAGAYNGSSLHVTFSQAGAKSIPLPTNGLAKRDYYVEKTWANIHDAEPVTIKLIGQQGESGTPYVAATITLDGVVDTNTNPEYEAWKGKFFNLPIYYAVGKDIFPIMYSVQEDPVPGGFLTPVYGGSAATSFTVYNEKLYGSLTVLKTVETGGAVGLTVPDFSITITGPSYPSGDTKVFNQTNGMQQTWNNLIPGTYTVTESGIAPPWDVVINPETYLVEGGANTTVDVTVTNTYTPGSLTVLKVVDTNDAIGLTVPDFSITITGPSYPSGDTKVFNEDNGMQQTWDNLIPGTYTVTEPGVEAPWSVGIDHETFDVVSGEDTTVDVTVTNTYTPGTITVTKNVTVLSDDPEIVVNYTFYAALFEDQEGTMVRVTDLEELQVVDSQSTTAVFHNLVAGKTYYVFETDDQGNIIETEEGGTIVTPILPDWTKIIYENAVVTLTPTMMHGEATLTNVFEPEDMPLYGSITVVKQVTLDGKPIPSTRTFYVALFADEELTQLISEVKMLKMNGNSSTMVEFLMDKDENPLEAGTIYYIAETDKDGVPLSGNEEELGFEISIDKPMVVITEEGTTVKIINKFKKEEFPLTGDNFNGNLWFFLALAGLTGAIAPFVLRRKEDDLN